MSHTEQDDETPSSDPAHGQDQSRSGSPTMSHLSAHSMDSPMAFSSEIHQEEVDVSSQAPPSVQMRPRRHSHRSRRKSSVTEAETKTSDEPSLPSETKRHSKDSPMAFGLDPTSLIKTEVSSPAADSVSLCGSQDSKGIGLDFAKENTQFPVDDKSAEVSSDGKTDINSIFGYLEKILHDFVSSQLRCFRRAFTDDFMDQSDDGEHLNAEWNKHRSNFLDHAVDILKQMKLEHLADSLKNRMLAAICQFQTKGKIKTKFQNVSEGIQKMGETTPLNQIYTELYIIEGEVEFSVEHEITQIQMKSPRAITILKSTDIFSPPGRDRKVRTVLTKGVAGIGKTVLTQKFSLDWAEGISNQNIHFILPFTFRELNLLRGESISLYGLIGHFFTETYQGICRFEEFQCLFIFDGLDECRLEMDFSKAQRVTDVREKISVEVLLVNIIRGALLPSALIWITSRPAAASQIPAVCVDMVTEVRGFTDPQKEIYFKKKFSDEEQALKVISHVKASRSIHNMCSIPVFSWITANVMDNILQTEEGTLPQTLTELYIHFLVVQAKVTNVKYKGKSETDHHWSAERRTTVMLLSKLAFEQLLKGNLVFYESDLTDCGIDITEASVYSGLFSQMFKEERGLYQDKVFSFVHLSVQEFLAALHVHVFMESGVNLLSETQSGWSKIFGYRQSKFHLYKTAVDKALESPNGHLDLFLRFLLGLSLESNQGLLRGLVRQTGSPQINKETADYLKTLLDSGLSVEKNLTLLQCLNELKDSGLCEEVQAWLSSDKIPSDLSPAQWSALVCILLSIEEPEFDLSKYQHSENALLMLMPVVRQSTTAQLSGCGLSDKSCEALASELRSHCSLRELDLSDNLLRDSGLQLLCEGLKNSNYALHTLSLRHCGLTSQSCGALVSVLVSETNSLTKLDLSNNDLLDSGVKTLCSALKNPLCKLEILRLSGCQVSKSGCASLISVLSSGASCLNELDLSYNHPGETEAKQLTALSQELQKKLSLEQGGVERLQHDFSKYAYHLTFDLNTANKKIKVSENNKITVEQKKQPYPDHPDRFDYWKQVLCSEGLRGRKYWEVEVSGDVYIAVTYKSIKRRGNGEESCLGKNTQSWSLGCTKDLKMSVLHENRRRSLMKRKSNRIGVYLDWDSGILSFYEVVSEQRIHLHTIKNNFTEDVYPAFRIKAELVSSFVSLCAV